MLIQGQRKHMSRLTLHQEIKIPDSPTLKSPNQTWTPQVLCSLPHLSCPLHWKQRWRQEVCCPAHPTTAPQAAEVKTWALIACFLSHRLLLWTWPFPLHLIHYQEVPVFSEVSLIFAAPLPSLHLQQPEAASFTMPPSLGTCSLLESHLFHIPMHPPIYIRRDPK